MKKSLKICFNYAFKVLPLVFKRFYSKSQKNQLEWPSVKLYGENKFSKRPASLKMSVLNERPWRKTFLKLFTECNNVRT